MGGGRGGCRGGGRRRDGLRPVAGRRGRPDREGRRRAGLRQHDRRQGLRRHAAARAGHPAGAVAVSPDPVRGTDPRDPGPDAEAAGLADHPRRRPRRVRTRGSSRAHHGIDRVARFALRHRDRGVGLRERGGHRARADRGRGEAGRPRGAGPGGGPVAPGTWRVARVDCRVQHAGHRGHHAVPRRPAGPAPGRGGARARPADRGPALLSGGRAARPRLRAGATAPRRHRARAPLRAGRRRRTRTGVCDPRPGDVSRAPRDRSRLPLDAHRRPDQGDRGAGDHAPRLPGPAVRPPQAGQPLPQHRPIRGSPAGSPRGPRPRAGQLPGVVDTGPSLPGHQPAPRGEERHRGRDWEGHRHRVDPQRAVARRLPPRRCRPRRARAGVGGDARRGAAVLPRGRSRGGGLARAIARRADAPGPVPGVVPPA